MSEDIVLESSGASEFQMPNASEELFGSALRAAEPEPLRAPGCTRAGARGAPEPEPDSGARAGARAGQRELDAEPVAQALEPEATPELVRGASAEPEPAARRSRAGAASPPAGARVGRPQPDPMITESMAELLLSQGHREEALRVYRELDEQTRRRRAYPGQDRRAGAAAAAPQPKRPVRRRPTPADDRRATSSAPCCRHVRLQSASRSRTETATVRRLADAGGAPTRPAHDSALAELGLRRRGPRPPVPPFRAAGRVGQAASRYDDFFNAPPSGGASRPPAHPIRRATISTSSIPGCRT